MSAIDVPIKESLENFVEDIFAKSWWGKEREAVSLYAFGYLIKQCHTASVLYDPAQIGIEVRVPKPETVGAKKEVCKDIVIWPQPGMTCWDEQRKSVLEPLAVMEWKVNELRVSDYDLEWLSAFSASRPGFTGYALCLNLNNPKFRLHCVRIQNNEKDPNWLRL
jgi:hypothetical protein